MRFLISFRYVFLLVFLSGCAHTIQPMDEPLKTSEDSSNYVAAHYKSTGEYVEEGYIHPTSSPKAKYAANECSSVDGYTRRDGVVVSAHIRCKHDYSPPNVLETHSSSQGYTSSNYSHGPVEVKGYYRRNGTYVSPHTRSRRR